MIALQRVTLLVLVLLGGCEFEREVARVSFEGEGLVIYRTPEQSGAFTMTTGDITRAELPEEFRFWSLSSDKVVGETESLVVERQGATEGCRCVLPGLADTLRTQPGASCPLPPDLETREYSEAGTTIVEDETWKTYVRTGASETCPPFVSASELEADVSPLSFTERASGGQWSHLVEGPDGLLAVGVDEPAVLRLAGEDSNVLPLEVPWSEALIVASSGGSEAVVGDRLTGWVLDCSSVCSRQRLEQCSSTEGALIGVGGQRQIVCEQSRSDLVDAFSDRPLPLDLRWQITSGAGVFEAHSLWAFGVVEQASSGGTPLEVWALRLLPGEATALDLLGLRIASEVAPTGRAVGGWMESEDRVVVAFGSEAGEVQLWEIVQPDPHSTEDRDTRCTSGETPFCFRPLPGQPERISCEDAGDLVSVLGPLPDVRLFFANGIAWNRTEGCHAIPSADPVDSVQDAVWWSAQSTYVLLVNDGAQILESR